VSLWAKAKVAVVDLKTKTVVDNFATERHPTEMLLSPDGKHLYVAWQRSVQPEHDAGRSALVRRQRRQQQRGAFQHQRPENRPAIGLYPRRLLPNIRTLQPA
jgi:hypothetical protein